MEPTAGNSAYGEFKPSSYQAPVEDIVAEYDKWGGGYIWGTHQKDGTQMVAEIPPVEEGEAVVSIRGWGAIQHMKGLPCSPEEFQDAIGQFVTDAINEKLKTL